MNAILALMILSLAMPIYSEETQVEKRQEKRGVLGLGYGGYGGFGNAPIAGSAYGGYGQSYLGGIASGGHGISVTPAYGYSVPLATHGYAAPLYPSYRIGYSGGLGYSGASHPGGFGGHAYGGITGLQGYGARGLGYGAGIGYSAGLGHGLGAGLGAGYGHGW